LDNKTIFQLESSQNPHTSANAMLFARWQHHLLAGCFVEFVFA